MEENLLKERKQILMDIMKSKEYQPMKVKELAMVLNVPKEDREELRYVLNELMNEGKIVESKKGKFSIASAQILTGTFEGNRKGFGFVTIEGEDEDIFIPERCINGAINKDIVQVALRTDEKRHKHGKSGGGRSKEGEIVKILSHGTEEVVGIYHKSKSFGFVIPDDQKFNRDIFVPVELSKGAVTGHKVVVRITDYGGKNKKPEGIVKEIIGHINDPGTDIMSIVKAYNIPVEFSDAVMNYVEKIPDEIDSKEIGGRLDLRDIQTVTIDGEDAKDLDDAISLEKQGKFYHLGVHIADVSNYVKENSVLDKEALKRGTSVYLVDRVIPMLPQKLSNGICSLNQGCDRLALSCIMDIDEKGRVIGHRIAETVINVDRRMSYTNVQKILDRSDEAVVQEYQDFIPMFELMQELAGILRDKRMTRGSIDFDFPESKIYLNEKGVPVEIKPYERNNATRIIEDFMLIANETVAEDYFWQEIPFVYRTHDNPDPDKMRALELFINNFGYGLKMGKDDIHPKELQKLLKRIEGTPEEALISRITLRSLKQARYTTVATGHFGLAAQYYCHFTSPIRRYPDLSLHRAIKYLLAHEQGHKGNTTETGGYHYSMDEMLQLGQHCSMTERRADEATRDVADWLKCDFMLDQVGNVFKGVIASVTGFGFFVRLDELFIDGLVHVSSLDNDYYRFDQVGQRLIGESGGQTYRLGDRVEVKVEAVNMDDRKIDFSLISSERAPRNVGKTEREKAKKGGNGKAGGKRRQAGKRVNFEPDSAFRGEKKQKPKAAKKDARKAKKPSTKTQKIAAATKAKRAAKKQQAE